MNKKLIDLTERETDLFYAFYCQDQHHNQKKTHNDANKT